MRRLITVAFVFGCLTLSGRPSAAQDQPPPLPSTPFVVPALRPQHQPLSADQERELQQWVQNKAAWDHQQKRWQNGPAHNNYGKIVQRKSEPAPPAWLGRVLHDGGRDPERRARPDDRTRVRDAATAFSGSRGGSHSTAHRHRPRRSGESPQDLVLLARAPRRLVVHDVNGSAVLRPGRVPHQPRRRRDACSSSGRRESCCSGCRMLPGRIRFASAIRGA